MSQKFDPKRLRYPPAPPGSVPDESDQADRSYDGQLEGVQVTALIFTAAPLAVLIFTGIHHLSSDWRAFVTVCTAVFALLFAASVRWVVRRLRTTVTVGQSGVHLRRGRRTQFAAGWDEIADIDVARLIVTQGSTAGATVLSDETSVSVLRDDGTLLDLGHLAYRDGVQMIRAVVAWWRMRARPPEQLATPHTAARLRLRRMTPRAWLGYLAAIISSIAAIVASFWLIAATDDAAYLGLTLLGALWGAAPVFALYDRGVRDPQATPRTRRSAIAALAVAAATAAPPAGDMDNSMSPTRTRRKTAHSTSR